MADAFLLARSEAIRSGNARIVFLSAAATGNPPATDPAGTALVVDLEHRRRVAGDRARRRRPGCLELPHRGGRGSGAIAAQIGVAWRSSLSGGALAPGDNPGADPSVGATFQDPGGNPVTWVMFGGDGIPVTFDAGCNLGTIGSGGGAVYVTNGNRDYAVVLTPLGGVRVHGWNAGAGAWTD